MKFSVAGVVLVRALCRVSNLNGPVLLPEGLWCVTDRLSGTLDRRRRLRKLDMIDQHWHWHCKWIAYGSDGFKLGGKGCTRMRPKLHLSRAVLGHAFRLGVTGVLAYYSKFVIWPHWLREGRCVVLHRSIRE
jgi:hypothetical protein